LDDYLWKLEDHDLIYEERAVPELEYSFKHVLTQETAYQSLLACRRAAFHRKVAEGIETLYRERLEEFYEQLAYHYDESGDAEKTVEYLLKAGEKARRAYLNDEAIGYFQRALEGLDASPPLGES
jgi:predicted ATPase